MADSREGGTAAETASRASSAANAAAGRNAKGEIMSLRVTAASAVPTARLTAAQCGRVGQ